MNNIVTSISQMWEQTQEELELAKRQNRMMEPDEAIRVQNLLS